MTRSARRALPDPPPEDRDGSEHSVASDDGDVAAQRNADIEARIQRLQDLIKVRNEQLRDIYVLYKNRANAGVLNKPEDFEAAAIDRSTADPARLSPAVGYMDSLGEWHAETPPPTPPEAVVDIADEASLSDAKAISDESLDEDQAMPEDEPADAPAEVVAEPSPPPAVVPDAVKSLVTDYPSSPTPEALERPASNAPSVHDEMDTREEEEDEKFETPEPDAPEETVKVEEQDQVAASSPPLAEHSPRVSVPPVTRSQSAAPTPAAAVLPEAPPATPSVKEASPVLDPTPALSPTPTPQEPDEPEDASALTPSPSPPPAPVKAATPEEPQAELEPEPDEAVPASPVEEHDAMDVEDAVQPQSPETVTPSAIEAPPPVRRTPAYNAAAISALFAPPPPKSPGPLAADDPASPRRRLLQPPPTQTDVDFDFDAAQQPGPPSPPSVLVPESAFTRRLPIPPLSSLPPTFNHTIKPTRRRRRARLRQASCT
ncbi:hypothetical protein EXIGLDRAFT_845876 [Exidia glandulosa HHB12029]|uniref:Uncharacterized protein n=1 Tax=Exidia glandulosa HHB12029 TaxID=1314781 RepID=A0A165B9C6_EXIGL|nr:hypothetical protein EXIGLDRAFT_845876 [Exidia glandulosa HHB12029]